MACHGFVLPEPGLLLVALSVLAVAAGNAFQVCVYLQGSNYGSDSQNGNQMYNRHQQYIGLPHNQTW